MSDESLKSLCDAERKHATLSKTVDGLVSRLIQLEKNFPQIPDEGSIVQNAEIAVSQLQQRTLRMAAAVEQNAELNKQIAALRTELERANQEKASLQQAIIDQAKFRDVQNKAREETSSKVVADVESKIADAERTITQLEADKRNLAQRLKDTETSLLKASSASEERGKQIIADAESKVNDAESKLSQLEEEKRALAQWVKDMEASVLNAKTEMSQPDGKSVESEENLQVLTQRLRDSERYLAEAEQKVIQLQNNAAANNQALVDQAHDAVQAEQAAKDRERGLLDKIQILEQRILDSKSAEHDLVGTVAQANEQALLQRVNEARQAEEAAIAREHILQDQIQKTQQQLRDTERMLETETAKSFGVQNEHDALKMKLSVQQTSLDEELKDYKAQKDKQLEEAAAIEQVLREENAKLREDAQKSHLSGIGASTEVSTLKTENARLKGDLERQRRMSEELQNQVSQLRNPSQSLTIPFMKPNMRPQQDVLSQSSLSNGSVEVPVTLTTPTSSNGRILANSASVPVKLNPEIRYTSVTRSTPRPEQVQGILDTNSSTGTRVIRLNTPTSTPSNYGTSNFSIPNASSTLGQRNATPSSSTLHGSIGTPQFIAPQHVLGGLNRVVR